MSHKKSQNDELLIPVDNPERFEGPRHRRAVLGLAKAALEITEKERLIAEGMIDKKTGLKNDKAFIEEIEERIENSNSGDFSLLFFDLDKLKSVNDTISWGAGDKYKITAGETVSGEFKNTDKADYDKSTTIAKEFGLRDTDEIYIIGGDEIVVLLDHRLDEKEGGVDYRGITERVQEKVSERVYGIDELKNKQGLGVSAGWSIFEDGDSRESIVERAHDMVLEQKDLRYQALGGQEDRLQDTRL
jgi:GGDEF domain-containing protein